MRHEARQVPSWLIFDVRQMKDSEICQLWDAVLREYGIAPERLTTYSSADALTIAAIQFGMPPSTTYGDKVHAVCVQMDDIPGGPDFRILLRLPLHADLLKDTIGRLRNHGFSEVERSIVCASEASLASFLLLHEIAHHRSKHHPQQDYATKEVEADRWAWSELAKSSLRKKAEQGARANAATCHASCDGV